MMRSFSGSLRSKYLAFFSISLISFFIGGLLFYFFIPGANGFGWNSKVPFPAAYGGKSGDEYKEPNHPNGTFNYYGFVEDKNTKQQYEIKPTPYKLDKAGEIRIIGIELKNTP